MKQIIIFILLILTTTNMVSQQVNLEQTDEKEKELLIGIVETCFINGALNEMNVYKMNEGFHPDFAILIPQGEEVSRLTLPVWTEVIEKYKASPEKRESGLREVDYKCELIDITGNAAIVKIQLYRKGQLITTDYISFLKLPSGWKAVSKISNEHITNPFDI